MYVRLSLAVVILTASFLSAPTAAAAGTCDRDASWGRIRVSSVLEVVRLTNEHRAGLGLAPLSTSRALTRAALWKAAHMAAYGYLDHDDPAPPVARTWDQRIEDCGYQSGAGENIAAGYSTPESVMSGWLESEGHRSNIESPGYAALGVGAATAADGTFYWVQVFGTVDDSANDVHGAPSATSDALGVAEDAPVVANLAANDSDPDGDPIDVVTVATPSNGTATVVEGGVRYRPDANFYGGDSFSYTVVDVFGHSSSADVQVTVDPVNDPPIANDDTGRVRPGRRVKIVVLANDDDVEGDSLTLQRITSGPTRGFATFDPTTGSVLYRARRRSAGSVDRLTYEVADESGAVSRARVTVTIRRR